MEEEEEEGEENGLSSLEQKDGTRESRLDKDPGASCLRALRQPGDIRRDPWPKSGSAPNPIFHRGRDGPLDQAPPSRSRICNVCMFHIQASFQNPKSTPPFLSAVPSRLSLCVIGQGWSSSAGGEPELRTVPSAASLGISWRRMHTRGCQGHLGHQQGGHGQSQPCQDPRASKQKEKSIRQILSVFTVVIFCRVGICLGFFLCRFQFLKIVPRLPPLLRGPGASRRRAGTLVLVLLLAHRCDLE